MSFLDLATGDQRVAEGPQPGEAAHLPATFGQAFEAAWTENQLFGNSIAHLNATRQALDNFENEIRQAGGNPGAEPVDISISGEVTLQDRLAAANAAAAKVKAANPAAQVGTLTEDDLDQRAMDLSRAARTHYADIAGREQASTGGLTLGGLSGAINDPINLVAAPVGGGEGALLVQALKFGGAAAATQAANEVIAGGYREQVQPGYLESAEPAVNVAMAFGQGAIFGGATRLLGNAWRAVKTRVWPTSIRDAGNIVESEANIQGSNVYPGVAGEVAHREALSTAVDQVTRGEPVDVAHIITPEIEQSARNITTRLEGERAMSLPIFDERSVRLTGEAAALRERDTVLQSQLESIGEGNPAAAARLATVEQIERQMEGAIGESRQALARRRDELLSGTTPDELRAQAAPIELRRQAGAERANIARRLDEIAQERAGLQQGAPAPAMGQTQPVRMVPFEQVRAAAGGLGEAARAERAATATEPAPELPFRATATEAQAGAATEALRTGIGQIAERGGHMLSPDEIAALADRIAKMTPDEAAGATRELRVAPHQLADRLAERPPRVEPEPGPLTTPAERAAALADPKLPTAMETDLDRARMLKDTQVPAGVNERGEPIYQSVDKMLSEVEQERAAADQLEACVNPAPEPNA